MVMMYQVATARVPHTADDDKPRGCATQLIGRGWLFGGVHCYGVGDQDYEDDTAGAQARWHVRIVTCRDQEEIMVYLVTAAVKRKSSPHGSVQL